MIEVKHAAKVCLPDELSKALVLNMFAYTNKQGKTFFNYTYDKGVAYLPPAMPKLKVIAGLLGTGIEDSRSEGESLSSPFVLSDGFNFREYQEEPAKELLAHVLQNNYSTLSAGCGTGKTIVMTYVAGQLQKKILILLGQTNLVGNWEVAFDIIYNKPLQIIKATDTVFSDVCVCTFQLLHRRPELLTLLRTEVGCLLIDEAHSVTAETFKQVMFRLDNKYRIGCSATFFNKNIPTAMLEDLIAPVSVTMVDKEALIPTVRWVDTGVEWVSTNPDDFSSILAHLAESPIRNSIVFQELRGCFEQKRRTIVACINIAQARFLDNLMRKLGARSEVYVGTTSKKRDKELKDKFEGGELDFVHMIKKMEQGTDFPSADCIALVKPNNNLKTTQQLTGRVVRKFEGKPDPIVIDFRDEGKLSAVFCRNRTKFYNQLNYKG